MTTDDDGENLFTAGEDRSVKVWELLTGILIRVSDSQSLPIKSVSKEACAYLNYFMCNPDGKSQAKGKGQY